MGWVDLAVLISTIVLTCLAGASSSAAFTVRPSIGAMRRVAPILASRTLRPPAPRVVLAGSRSLCMAADAKAGGRASAAVVQDAQGKKGGSEKMDLLPPKGTRDFFPEDMRLRNWLFGHMREVASHRTLPPQRR
jgi:hypothetical protein